MKRRTTGYRKGFTLVELIVAMALFSVLCLAAIPAFLRLAENGNLKSAARDVTTDMVAMKQTALNRSAPCSMTFNAGTNSYTLTMPDGNTQVKTLASFSPDIVITEANFGGGPTMAFQSRGTASMGHVSLQNSRGSTATITVNITGRTYAEYTMQ